MLAVNAFAACIAVVGAGLIRRSGTPSCAESCFQEAVNDHGCEDWLSDADCCGSRLFLFQIAFCLYEPCSHDDALTAWDEVASECEKVDWEVADYDVVKTFAFEYYATVSSTSTEEPESTKTSEATTTSEDPTTTEDAESTTDATFDTTTSSEPTETPESKTTLKSVSSTRIVEATPTFTPPSVIRTPHSTPTFHRPEHDYVFDSEIREAHKLSPGSIAAIAIGVSAIGVVLAIFFFRFCQHRRQRRKKYSPANIEPADGAEISQETSEPKGDPTQAVYEICGTELSRTDNDPPLELEGTPAPPTLDCSTPRISQSEACGGLDVDSTRLSPSPARHQRTDSDSRLSELRRFSEANSFSPVSPLLPALPLSGFDPISLSGPISPTSENDELTDLLSDLAAMERQRRERAAQLQLLHEQELAIRAEEAAILEKIRKKASMMPERSESPGSSRNGGQQARQDET